MAEKGFKRKLAAITVAKCYSRLAYDSDEPLLHNLTNFLTSMTDLAHQYLLTSLIGQLDVMTCNVENSL